MFDGPGARTRFFDLELLLRTGAAGLHRRLAGGEQSGIVANPDGVFGRGARTLIGAAACLPRRRGVRVGPIHDGPAVYGL